jgi:hypothetical protein
MSQAVNYWFYMYVEMIDFIIDVIVDGYFSITPKGGFTFYLYIQVTSR